MSAILDVIRRFFYPIAVLAMRKADVERRFQEFLHRGEIAEAPVVEDMNQAAREDTWAAEACALTADHFDLWEKELSKR